MYKFLILLVVCLIGTTTMLYAQVPNEISVPYQFNPNAAPAPSSSLLPCNFAGTFTLGTFTGQSNDTALDTIYLCEGDQIQIDHNGDFDLSGDPVGATPPGVAWAFYTCLPTIVGDSYQTLLANEPCLLLGPTGAPTLAFGQPNGDITFNNNGNLQTTYNAGQPVLFHFAPITVDNFDPVQTYENNIVGAPPGPCLNVNTAVAFQVVYLNAIAESGVSSNFGNDCLGKFRISGGYPQWNSAARYTIDISLQGNPGIKALIHNNADQIGNNADVIFSVSQPGVYVVTIEDGKSCGHSFTIAMNGCNPVDNIVVTLPDTIAPPNSQICIPVQVENFQVIGASFSIEWDPSILQYNGVQNPSDSIGTFNASNLNTQQTAQGQLGIIVYNQDVLGNVIDIPDGGTLLEICFTVVGPLDSCSSLNATNDPTLINIENQTGTTVAVTAPPGQVCVGFLPLDIAVEVIDTTCTGTASIKVTATGGVAGYDVLITDINTGLNFSGNIATAGASYIRTGVQSGTFSVCVTDANNETICDTVTLNIPILGASLQNTQRPTCFGFNDGIVTAVVSLNGTAVPNPGPNFTFTWSPANPGGNVPVFNNASSGNYSVTLTETTSGCTASASGTLDQPLPLIIPLANITVTPTTCTGVFNGGITLHAQGGTPFPGTEYQYNWEFTCSPSDPPAFVSSFQDSLSVLTGLQNCTYYVTVTDATGVCTVTEEIDVKTLRDVALQVTSPTPIFTNCFGDSSADICVQVVETPASANPNYSFFWTPVGFPQTTPSTTSSCYEDLPAGVYNVLAIDAIGCADTLTVEVFSPEVFFLDTVEIQKPNCTFQNNGAITVQGFGGTGFPNGYTYAWSTMDAGNMIMNLLPGNYSVTATDQKGCVDSLSFTLSLPLPPVIAQVDSSSVKCGSDGSLSVTSPTGVTYQWVTIGGLPVVGGDSSAIFNLQGDTFVVTIMDNQGCTTVDTFTLAPVTPMSFSDTTFTEPACFGYSDGIISVGVIDGNPNYTYDWSVDSLGSMSSTIIGVPAGNYTVTITDQEGCTLVGNFTLNQPPQILISFTVPTPTSCFGVCDGGIIASAQYGTTPPTSSDFNFVWSDGGTDSVRTNLCADTVSLIVIDSKNCFSSDMVIIPGPPEVTYDTLYTLPASCNGSDDGQAIVDGAGGNGAPYTYQWSNGDTGPIADNLTAQEWEVTITDNNGCTAEYTAEVTQPEPIVVLQNDTVTMDVKCFGGSDGKLGVTASGGNAGGYTYSWADQSGTVIGSMQNESGLPAGTYSVTVTDLEGCTGILQNLVIIDPPPVQGSYLPFEQLLCFGDETTLYIDTIFGGSGGPFKFSLDFGVVLDPDFPVSLSGGEHYITYFDRFDCEFTDTITVPEPDPIIVTFNPPTYEIELGDTSYQLKPFITGAVVDTFIWFPGESLRDPDDLSPFVHTYTTETYTLTVYDVNGCEGSGSITIDVDPNRNVFVPNVFKPANPSGLNDHFYPIVGLGVEFVNYMRVYDRWGGLVYELNDFYPDPDNLSQGWDGRFNGDYVDPAVFVYVIEVRFLDGKVLTYRGDVTVVR